MNTNTPNKSKRSFQQLVLFLLLAFTVGAACADTIEKAACNQGLTLFKKGDFKSARRAFESSILNNPDNAATHFYLGLTHNRLHAYADAVHAFEKAHELNPALSDVQLNLGISYYKLKTYKPALMTLRRALSKNPESGEAHFFTGLTLQGEGQFSQSIPHFEKAIMLEPDYAQMSSYYIGRAYHKTGQRPLAQEALRQSVAIDPTSEIGQMAEDLSAVLADSDRPEKSWWLRAEIGYEYNDNLTVEQTDTVSDEADHAAVIEMGGGLKLLSQPIKAEITYDFSQSLYSEYSQFNMQSHRAGVSASHDFDSWDLSLDYDYTYIFLDSDEFMGTQSVMPAVGLSFADLYTSVSYIWQAKDFLDDEDEHRDARNHSGGIDFFLFSLEKIGMINIGVRYEYEDAEDEELDYAGPVLSASLRLNAPWGITVRPSYKYHLKEYDNMTVSIGEEREDIKQTLGLSLTKNLPYGLKLKCGYKHIDSESNYSISEYNENTVFAGLTYSL